MQTHTVGSVSDTSEIGTPTTITIAIDTDRATDTAAIEITATIGIAETTSTGAMTDIVGRIPIIATMEPPMIVTEETTQITGMNAMAGPPRTIVTTDTIVTTATATTGIAATIVTAAPIPT